jgi:two-component system, OmpR family, sensor histidine kinase TctE
MAFRWAEKGTAPMWSLSGRLAFRLSVVMFSAILVASAAVALWTVMTLHDLDDRALQQQVRLVAGSLPPDRGSAAPINVSQAVTAPFHASDGDNLFMVFSPERRLLTTSDSVEAQQAALFLPRPFQQGFFRIPLIPGHPHGMVGFATATGRRWVVVLQGREQTSVLVNSLMARFLIGAIWLLLPIGCVTVLVSLTTVRRGLRPLLQASAAARAVGPGQVGVRLPVTGLPREVSPLVEAVNAALTRLEQTIETQRNFMAQAAHGLRTPLAVLTARLDSLGDAEAAEVLRRDVDRMARLVGQLLRMARLESLPLDVTQVVDLHSVVAEAIVDLAPLGLGHDVELALTGDETVPTRGNHAALVLAATNLVENAIGYAPPGSVVEVEVARPASITVRDRGPGVSPDDRARILEPFERGPNARAGGAGLGLAIVKEIAAAHRGTLRVNPRPGGGAAFVLKIGTVDLMANSGASALEPALAAPHAIQRDGCRGDT